MAAVHLPLGAVHVAGMTFIVDFSVFKYETVGTLKTIRTLFHAVWTVFKIKALHAMLRALQEEKG